ncbi:MAG: alpha/beta hydrolase [Betaproteobacteria bacterium]|nr:alpha/beta hydrolase [Betaproteobacteria bacterium]MDH4323211.1 alpha/beta hydrolase [Betaproteobacteria bacterium]
MSEWQPDKLLAGFEARTLEFPDDYEGRVVATLVRLPAGDAPRGAVLYVHGFVDYFFQRHMAERFAAEGYAFYALDLRRHGRSWLAHQHPCFCKDLAEYDADITAAIDEIGGPVLLAGHSTGGLICSLYAARGERRDQMRALWLNSPFFDWKVSPVKRAQLGMAALMGQAFPLLNDPKALKPVYIRSIHRDFDGEWDFDLKLKPLHGFPAYFGWIGAVLAGQHKVHAGLEVKCPVLTMHSDEADIVLDWRHVAKWGRTLGPQASVLAFPGGLHDLVLSRREVRDGVFSALFSWAARVH